MSTTESIRISQEQLDDLSKGIEIYIENGRSGIEIQLEEKIDYTEYNKYVEANKGFEDTIMGFEQWSEEKVQCENCERILSEENIDRDFTQTICYSCGVKYEEA